MTEQIMLTPIEAINEFYRLKDKYENSYYEKYVKPIVKSNKSKREKRLEFSRLPKHECINCKRNVGTLFNIKPILEESIKKYTEKTKFEIIKTISPVKNRLVIFDGLNFHASTKPKINETRIVITVNFI